jgi:hypothetical protein
MPIIFEETYSNIIDSRNQDSQVVKKKIQPSLSSQNNLINCIKPNSEDYCENKFVNSKSYPSNLTSTNKNFNGRSLSSTSTSSSSNNDVNSNNVTKMTKSKELFLKRSKKSSKDIIASETTTIKLVSYIKKTDESEFVNNYEVLDSRPPTIPKNYLVKSELTSSLPTNSINKKSFIFKKLSIDEDLTHLSNTESEDKPNSKSSNESSNSGFVNEDENAVSACNEDLVLQQHQNLDIQTPMAYNERPIDVEFVEPNLINEGDMKRNSEIFTETNRNSNLMPPPSDCSFKSKVLYESFRGRTNTLDRRRLNKIKIRKPFSFKEIEEIDHVTSTPIKNIQKQICENNNDEEENLKRKDSKLIKHLSVNTDTNSLCPLANDSLFK